MYINGIRWKIEFTDRPEDLYLDGSIRLGITDRNVHTIYLSDKLCGALLRKVLLHELTHAWLFSYGYDLDVETEELLCTFVDTYSEQISEQVDRILTSKGFRGFLKMC